MKMKLIHNTCMSAVAAAFAFASFTAIAQPSLEIRQDRLQLQSDRAALQRQIGRLDADEKKLKADSASGRMSAESKDAYEVYMAQEAVKGAKENVADYKIAEPRIRLDKLALQRQMKRLEIAEARLAADKASGKMAAESKDSTAVARDQQAVKGAQQNVAAGVPGSLQMQADVEALQRALKRLETDEATLKANKASGKMSAESKDSYELYQASQAVKGEKKAVTADEAAALQMAADKATLQRQLKRLQLAEARLAADKGSGKMAAESKDSARVSGGQQAVKAEKKQIAADRAELKADQKK